MFNVFQFSILLLLIGSLNEKEKPKPTAQLNYLLFFDENEPLSEFNLIYETITKGRSVYRQE